MQFRQEDSPATEGRAVEVGEARESRRTASFIRGTGSVPNPGSAFHPSGRRSIPIDRTRAAGLFIIGSKLNT
jgi:hypothetical protein